MAKINQLCVGESLIGDGNEVAHIDLIMGPRGSAAETAFANCLTNNKDGFTSLLAVVAPNLLCKPATVLFNKVTIKGAKQAVQMFGPAQHAVAKAVADSVAEGIIPQDEADNIFICCGVFIHWEATDDKKIQDYNYRAVKEAIARAVAGDPKPAEVVAKRYKINRQVQDEYSLLSQQRTAHAQNENFFDAEIAPIQVTRGLVDKKTGEIASKEFATVSRDECNRPDTTLEGLLALKPHFDPDSGRGSVTAGNSSQLSDGASATLLMSRQRADHLGIPYKLIFRGFQISGCEPDEMGIGPVFAVPKLLGRAGLKMSDIGLWELNEAFAVQVIYCRDRLGIDPEQLNVNGGSISIGHPFGMTGSRMVGTLANEMARRKSRYGVVTMCVGGGQGAAGLFELAA